MQMPPAPGKGAPANMWEEPPPHDPAGAKKNAEIDEWLKQEKAREIAQKSKTLVISPDGDSFNAFRERILQYFGEYMELSDGRKTKMITERFEKNDKKRMAGMEPSVLVFAIDVGTDTDGDDANLLMKMTRALAHFSFVAKHLGLGENCAVIILIARTSLVTKSMTGPAKDSWARIFPALNVGGESARAAIETEFEAAANANAQPLEVKGVFDDGGFDDLSFLRGMIQESLDQVLLSFHKRVGTNPDSDDGDRFHDATEKQGTPEAQAAATAGPQAPTARERMFGWMSGFLFAIQVVLFAVGVGYAIPWESILVLWYALLDYLGVPQLY